MTPGEAIAHVRDVLLPALRLDAEKPWNSHLRAHVPCGPGMGSRL